MAKGNERNDQAGGIGQGGPQSGPYGGGDKHQRKGEDRSIEETGGMGAGELGQGGQRNTGGSSYDSETLESGNG